MATDEIDWRYERYYFGSGGWPSEAVWRVTENRHELWIDYPVQLDSLDTAREEWRKNRTAQTLDASATQDRSNMELHSWSLGWWYRYPELKDELYYYERDARSRKPTVFQPDSSGIMLD